MLVELRDVPDHLLGERRGRDDELRNATEPDLAVVEEPDAQSMLLKGLKRFLGRMGTMRWPRRLRSPVAGVGWEVKVLG